MVFSAWKSRPAAWHSIKSRQYPFLAWGRDVGFPNYHMKLKMLTPLPKGNPPSSWASTQPELLEKREVKTRSPRRAGWFMCKHPLWFITREKIILSFPEACRASLIWQRLWGLPASGHKSLAAFWMLSDDQIGEEYSWAAGLTTTHGGTVGN